MIKRNFYYRIEAKPANPTININAYQKHFPIIVDNYNKHITDNPKEISNIELSKDKNIIIFEFYAEKALPANRELQSLRRFSEELALYDPNIVYGKSHVLISA